MFLEIALCDERQKPILWRLTLSALTVLAVEGMVFTAGAYAQDPVAGAALECFEESRRRGEVVSSDCDRGVVSAESIVLKPRIVSPTTVEAVLDGLERLALGSDSKRVRISAAGWLTAAGKPDADYGRPWPGVVDRAAAVYQRSDDWVVRSRIVAGMPRQAEKVRAVEFLKQVSREERPEEHSSEQPVAFLALTELLQMGPLGQAALQQLHAEGTVRNSRARGYLEGLAENSFRPSTE